MSVMDPEKLKAMYAEQNLRLGAAEARIRELQAENERLRLEWARALKGQEDERQAVMRQTLALWEPKLAEVTEALRLRNLEAVKHQQQNCLEPGCSEPAPPYCARHRGDWNAALSRSPEPPAVAIDPADLARVYEHGACGNPACPACSGPPAKDRP